MSTIKVNTLTTRSGCTMTLGESGKTIALATGASQTGFGRTGTVDWNTTPKTSTFTAVSGDGFFCNTSGGAFTCNFPSGTAGSIISLADYANTWNTNNLTISPNGSQKIGSVNANIALNTQGQSVTFVYVDDTQGWINVQDSTSNVRGAAFISATGGTVTQSGNFKIHTFTSPGTFCVSALSNQAINNTVGYVIVAGGGSGGSCCAGGGGGAGGYREGRNTPVDNFTASPLVASFPGSNCNAITVTASAFPITVGAGGSTSGDGVNATQGNKGSNSVFSTITSAGGGGGYGGPTSTNKDGGSGGGASHGNCAAGVGSGNTPPVTPPQGQNGGAFTSPNPSTADDGGGGGGGAGGVGVGGSSPTPIVGQGGPGVASEITASPVTRAGGGSAGMRNNPGGQSGVPVPGGPGGGGAGGGSPNYPRPASEAAGGTGTANTGGGGGGGARTTPGSGSGNKGLGGAGGSGVVIIRYKFQ